MIAFELPKKSEVARILDCAPASVDAMERAGLLQSVMTSRGKRYPLEQVLLVWRRGRPWMGTWSKPC